MEAKQLQEGIAYAEINYNSKNGFSKLDKEIIQKNFPLENKDVLDFGCGMGHMTLWFAEEMRAKVDGVDIDENHITVAREFIKLHPSPNITLSLRNIITDPVAKQYDFIFLNDVIEHIKIEWIQEVLDVLILKNLKPGGVIFFSYPPWEGPHASHLQPITKIPWVQFFPDSYIKSIIKKRNRQLVGKHDTLTEYQELNHMTHSKLRKLLKKYPLTQILRKSHTKLNKLTFLRNANLNYFPFKYIVTKELIAFRKD
jgi:2-polyprenyl-3-methyl-5-hydroxy-6-metoxy-1,4-benzoquinol methylase